MRPGAVGIDGIIELARAVPECRIVAAHACGNWRKAVKRVAEFPENIVFDVSGGYPERGMVERLAAAFGSDRLLYGSDAYGRSFGSQLFKVLGSKLSEGDLRKILYTNAMRVFRLPGINVESKISLSAWQIPGGNEDHFCFVGKSSYFDHAVDCRNLVEAAAHCGVDTLFAADLSVLESVDRVAANEEFKIEAKDFPAIKPLAAVNLINRQDCLRQLENMEGFAGIWISPYCDNYKLDYDSFREFFDLCAQRKIFVWINTALSDYRFRCKKLHSRVVSTAEIAEFIRQAPENYYTFQGVNMPLVMHQTMPEYCRWECSRLSDGEYSAEHLLRDKMGDVHNLCWGSEYPFREYDAVKSVLSGKL